MRVWSAGQVVDVVAVDAVDAADLGGRSNQSLVMPDFVLGAAVIALEFFLATRPGFVITAALNGQLLLGLVDHLLDPLVALKDEPVDVQRALGQLSALSPHQGVEALGLSHRRRFSPRPPVLGGLVFLVAVTFGSGQQVAAFQLALVRCPAHDLVLLELPAGGRLHEERRLEVIRLMLLMPLLAMTMKLLMAQHLWLGPRRTGGGGGDGGGGGEPLREAWPELQRVAVMTSQAGLDHFQGRPTVRIVSFEGRTLGRGLWVILDQSGHLPDNALVMVMMMIQLKALNARNFVKSLVRMTTLMIRRPRRRSSFVQHLTWTFLVHF